MSYDKSALPAMFRSARESKGLTQDQVGEMIGMSGNGYSKIESGRNGVPIDLIWPICDALGVPPTGCHERHPANVRWFAAWTETRS